MPRRSDSPTTASPQPPGGTGLLSIRIIEVMGMKLPVSTETKKASHGKETGRWRQLVHAATTRKHRFTNSLEHSITNC